MKHSKKLKGFLIGSLTLPFANIAHAQSNVNLYGLLETGVRYSTNQTASGGNLLQLGDGVLNPSRWGLTGSEDLGGGLKANFTLESGLQLKNGVLIDGTVGTLNNDSASSSRIFGRLAYIGLSGDFGSLNLGRQYTTAFLSSCGADPLCGGGLMVYSPYILYTGVRQDNMVTYQKSVGPVALSAHYTFGEQAGNTTSNSGYGLGAGYATGPFAINAAYQENHLMSSSVAKLFTVNTSYQAGAAKLLLGYVSNQLSQGSNQKNSVIYGGVTYSATPAVTLKTSAYYDKQQNSAGSHLKIVGLADYAFSKRTATYLEVDYNKYKDAMLPFGSSGPNNQFGATLGLRHQF